MTDITDTCVTIIWPEVGLIASMITLENNAASWMWELVPPLHSGRVTLVKELMRFLFQPHWHTFDLGVRKPSLP